MKFKTFAAILFVVLIIVFTMQNAEVTDIKFIFWKISYSRVIVILGSFFIGVLVGVLISIRKKKVK